VTGLEAQAARALAADGDIVNDFLDKLQNAKVKSSWPTRRHPPAVRARSPHSDRCPHRKDKDRATKTLLVGTSDEKKRPPTRCAPASRA